MSNNGEFVSSCRLSRVSHKGRSSWWVAPWLVMVMLIITGWWSVAPPQKIYTEVHQPSQIQLLENEKQVNQTNNQEAVAKPIMNMKEYGARYTPYHVYYFAIGHNWALGPCLPHGWLIGGSPMRNQHQAVLNHPFNNTPTASYPAWQSFISSLTMVNNDHKNGCWCQWKNVDRWLP